MEIKELLQKHTLTCLAGGFVLGLLACGVGSAMLHITGTPEFCGNCHSMKLEAATFAESSHREQDCAECHLPHENAVVYLAEKGRSGMVDMYHEVLRDYPARIKLSENGRQIVNSNCMRCHSAAMEGVRVGTGAKDTSDCMKCHSRIAHGSNHLEGGIKVE